MPVGDLTGLGIAKAKGTGYLSYEVPITGVGEALAAGVGFPEKPGRIIPDDLQDRWFYGGTLVRDMNGTGHASAGGVGALSS